MFETQSERGDVVHKPESFLIVAEPRGQSGSVRMTGALPFRATVETADYSVTLAYTERLMLTVSDDGQRSVLFSGDLYRPETTEIGRALLHLYEQCGPAFAQDLHGAFALALIDRAADQIIFVTDRENSVKLLYQWDGASLIVSNSTYLQPVRGARLDRAAVACYLAAGFIYNDRTFYEPIRMLDGASVYRLRAGRLEQDKYWRFVFAPSNDSLERRKQTLGDRLIEAVRVRLRADQPTYLSLSAGEDARAILGALAALRVPDVRCFSYALDDEPRPDSDERLSAQLAALAGYPFQIVRSFDGDATGVIERNARMGGGMVQVCDEVDAWMALGAGTAGQSMPVMFTGDTRFFRFDFEVRSVEDATFGSYMPDFSVLAWLRPLIGEAVYAEMLAATRSELDVAVKRLPPTKDGYELRDMLGFNQVHSRLTGTWREYYAGRFFRQARPLLDDDILDLFLQTPTRLRRRKRLYIETMTERFPQIFAIPRASSASYATYWPGAIRRQNAELRALIERQPSLLDELIPPDVLALLAANLPALTQRNAAFTAAVKRAYHLLKRAGWRSMPFARPSLFRSAVPAYKFLTRALVLRGFLAEMDRIS